MTSVARPRRRLRATVILFVLAVAAAGAGYWYFGGDAVADKPQWRTVKLTRGSIASTVSASGTLKAVVTVEVGSQVSGQIKALYADYNSEVRKGQRIALIDPATFKAKVVEAEADLAVARATISMHQARLTALAADIRAARAALAEAKADFERKQELMPTRAITKSAFDKAQAVYTQSVAKLEGAIAKQAEQTAQLRVARAQVLQKQATLEQRKLDLERTIIRSPVDGVVIARSINVGQTVAASLQAPILFTIAQDLRHMQVEVSVDEADIGRIQVDQAVEFTVDSFPGRTFPGVVRQVRLEPKEVSNVITYTVVVSASNADLRLLPGMTANVTFNVSRRENVVLVSNRALRFRPPNRKANPSRAAGPRGANRARGGARLRRLAKQLKLTNEQQAKLRDLFAEMGAKAREMRARGGDRQAIIAEMRKARARMPGQIMDILTPEQRKIFTRLSRRREANPVRRATLWVVGEDGEPKSVSVWTGISDGRSSEIVRGPLKAGDAVIVGVEAQPRRRRLRFGL